jgi:hypothetical protein
MKRILWTVLLVGALLAMAGYGWDRLANYYRHEQQLSTAKKMEAGLATEVSLERIAGEDCRVWDALRHVDEQTEISLWWDEETLSLHGDGRTELVSIPNVKLPLKTALELILSQTGAVYYVDRGRIVISAEPLREKYVMKAYPLPSLGGTDPERENQADDWIDAIMGTMGGFTWNQGRGGGTIEPIPGGLVIHQTEAVHREIRELLDQFQPAPPISFREALGSKDSRERRLQAALDAPCDWQFVETPFYEAVQQLANRHQVPLVVCRRNLEEGGQDWRAPISLSLKDISLRSALRIFAGQVDCCCILHRGVLQVTTPEDASSRVYTQVYDVRDLVHYEEGDLIDFDSLLELVYTIVSPDQWEGSGPGPIETLNPGWMIFSQTEDVHRETSQLLATIRLGLKPGSTGKDRRITLPQSPVEQQVEAALLRKVIFDYTEIPLEEVVRDISVLSGLNVVLDVRGLQEAAIPRDQSITCELPPLPLAAALTRLVDDAQPESLEWFVRDECVVITTRDRGRAEQSLLILDVRDILGGEHTPGRLDLDGLTDRVCSSVEPGSWDETGGSGSIAVFRSLLVVRSARRINERVANFLQRP